MPKPHIGNIETEDKKPVGDAAAISRRQVLGIAGQAASAGVFAASAGMLVACGADDPPIREVRGGMVDMGGPDMRTGPSDLAPAVCMPKIATGAETLAVNQAKHFYNSGIREQSFFVVRDSRGFYALNDDCPHNHCRAAFNATALTFDCPCHGSRFNLDGTLRNGPAATPLNVFPMKRLTNGQLEVDICRFTTDRNGRVT
jgi:Rieske Fe-S protein